MGHGDFTVLGSMRAMRRDMGCKLRRFGGHERHSSTCTRGYKYCDEYAMNCRRAKPAYRGYVLAEQRRQLQGLGTFTSDQARRDNGGSITMFIRRCLAHSTGGESANPSP